MQGDTFSRIKLSHRHRSIPLLIHFDGKIFSFSGDRTNGGSFNDCAVEAHNRFAKEWNTQITQKVVTGGG